MDHATPLRVKCARIICLGTCSSLRGGSGPDPRINWSGSFDAFGSSQGVRFPITWVNLNEVDVDA